MAISLSTSDIILLLVVGLAAGYYLFGDALLKPKLPAPSALKAGGATSDADGGDTGRDFYAALQKAVRPARLQSIGSKCLNRLFDVFTEKEGHHLLRLTDWYSRRLCTQNRKGIEIALWSFQLGVRS